MFNYAAWSKDDKESLEFLVTLGHYCINIVANHFTSLETCSFVCILFYKIQPTQLGIFFTQLFVNVVVIINLNISVQPIFDN